MRKFLKELWEVFLERQRTHRALRLLSKQEWSVEFLTALLVKAANVVHHPLEMTIVSPNGTKYIVRTADERAPVYKDDDIFNHLDDETRIREFMRTIGA